MMDFRCLSPDEVREKYDNTPYKKYMLGVLADLTASTEEEVAEFLGIEPPYKKRIVAFDEDQALELHARGLSDVKIARTLGVGVTTIWQWRTELNLPVNGEIGREELNRRRRELYNRGLSDKSIAEEEGCRPNTIRHWRHRNNLKPNFSRRGA